MLKVLGDDGGSFIVGSVGIVQVPFVNLGSIIVDEEHEPSYKEGSGAQVPCEGCGAVDVRKVEYSSS